MAAESGQLPGIEPAAVSRWLAEHVDGLVEPVSYSLVAGGRSNLTYRITDATGAVRALRRPPIGGVLSTAHDMRREWRFLVALAPTAVPVAHPIAYCDDHEVAGADFYVMEFVDGRVLGDEQAGGQLTEAARRTAGEQTVDVLADLHAIDPDEVGIGDIGRRDGYLERQLRRWQRQVHAAEAPEQALLDEVHDLLVERVPRQVGGIVHGDFRPGNLAYADDGRALAVFDWELATLGDSLADVGWLLSTWEEPGDTGFVPATSGPSTVPGFPTRAQLTERYARRSGRDLSDLPYYLAFSWWRGACIGIGVRARYLAGVMGDDGYVAEERTAHIVALGEAARRAITELGAVRR